VKKPNKHVGLAELHQDGAMTSKRSKMNVSNLMKHQGSSNSPRDQVNNQRSSSNVDLEERTGMLLLGQ
jgi:hypothetical protein